MRKTRLLSLSLVVAFVLAATLGGIVLADDGDVRTVPIQVAPGTILLGGDQAEMVTVHAEISYALVDKDLAITLNGVDVVFTKSDLRGELVAKFLSTDVKGEVEAGDALLTLKGTMTDGTPFTGSCIVRVVVFSGTGAASGK